MVKHNYSHHYVRAAALAAAIVAALAAAGGQAQSPLPTLVDSNLAIREVTPHLANPIGISSGRPTCSSWRRTRARCSGSSAVRSPAPSSISPSTSPPSGAAGHRAHPQFAVNGFVYLYWTESTTGADTDDLAAVPLLGNRVDRFRWNGSSLMLDRNLIKLRAFQADAGQPFGGNHDGGVIRFDRRQALHRDRRQRPARPARTSSTAPSGLASTTTSSAGPSRTTPT